MPIISTEESCKSSRLLLVLLKCSTRANEQMRMKSSEVLQRILNAPDDNEVGFIVEVNLIYPDELHDLHSDFPSLQQKSQ